MSQEVVQCQRAQMQLGWDDMESTSFHQTSVLLIHVH